MNKCDLDCNTVHSLNMRYHNMLSSLYCTDILGKASKIKIINLIGIFRLWWVGGSHEGSFSNLKKNQNHGLNTLRII